MTRRLCSEIADIKWLTGTEAGRVLADLADDNVPVHTAVARLRANFSADRTHLLIEQAELRRRAAAKFTRPERMFFTRTGLEQATDEWVAAYKASRVPSTLQMVDLCCGIGGDLTALAHHGPVIGIDHDPMIAHFATANSGADVRAIDIVAVDLDGVDAWHIDPDRRPGGRRTTSLDWCAPNRVTIERLMMRSPNAAIKLAPATDVPAAWAECCELEWISRDRECKQLVAWHGNLAATPSTRRATIVTRQAGWIAPVSKAEYRTITGAPNQVTPIAMEVSEYVFDADPAVIAARLFGTIAHQYGLCALSSGPTYLTGSLPIDDAALGCFRVSDVLPLRVNKLARHLRARNIGQLEIKKRGVEIELERLRRALKLRGPNTATLLITKVGSRPTAVLAQRVAT